MLTRLIQCAVFIFACSFSLSLHSNYIDDLLERADEIRSSNPEEFQSLLATLDNQQVDFSQQQRGYYQYLLAYQKSFEGQFQAAIDIYQSIIESNHYSIDINYRANLSLVNIYAIAKDWNNGLKHLLLSQQLSQSISDKELLDMGLLVNSVFYNQLEQYELGLEYANKLTSSVTEGREFCFAQQLKIQSLFELDRLTVNDPIISDAIEICGQGFEPVLLSAIYIVNADMLLKENQYQASLSLLEQQQSLFESTRYPPILAYAYSLFSEVHLALQNKPQAQEFAQKTLSYTASLGSSEPEVIANQVLYTLAEQSGDSAAALQYYKQYAKADKAYINDIKAKHLAFQLAKHRAAEQENSIELLRQQNNILLLKQKFDKVQSENNRLFIALLILCVTVLLGMIFKTKATQKKLHQLAQNDSLTGLFNRRHFTQEANKAINKCVNLKQVGSCILFDLDKFKFINDNYGHKTGDWVLKTVASECKSIVRNKDIFARIGGEEFCLFLPNCALEDAQAIAQTYRQKLTDINTSGSGFEFSISGSFGVSDFTTSGTSLDKLIADADNAMYQAKQSGRNKVCVSG